MVPLRLLVPATLLILTAACARWGGDPAPAPPPVFVEVEDVGALEAALGGGRITVVDVYASWCGPCRRLREEVFPAPEVAAGLREARLLTVDVSDDDGADRVLWKHLGVRALPTVLFFDGDGEELPDSRYTEVLGEGHFREHLRGLGLLPGSPGGASR